MGLPGDIKTPRHKQVVLMLQVQIEICDVGGCENKSVELLRKFHSFCSQKQFFLNPAAPQIQNNSLVRLGVLSLGDILWGESATSIFTFLLSLRALLRNSLAVGLVTVPSSLHEKD